MTEYSYESDITHSMLCVCVCVCGIKEMFYLRLYGVGQGHSERL